VSPERNRSLADRCRPIRLLVLDVDGVLTTGGVAYTDDGTETKTFYVRDGTALKLWQKAGKRTAWISGRASPVLTRRAIELGVEAVIEGAADKLDAYRRVLAETGTRPEEVCCVGDDLADVPLLRHCGLAVAVADACVEVRNLAHFITQAAGGRGAVREVVALLLRCQGEWQQLVGSLQADLL
jgi:3-deoxy-D-manno-octulosonate 8-phosphate phosphatase (KDO 8-P phosphatase)